MKKLDQKTPPQAFEDVGRFWGSSRNLLTLKLYQGKERGVSLAGQYCLSIFDISFYGRYKRDKIISIFPDQ
jgi:hypothetical protein